MGIRICVGRRRVSRCVAGAGSVVVISVFVSRASSGRFMGFFASAIIFFALGIKEFFV